MEIKNRKALFDYEILEKLIAGIVLTGTEIKSIREGKASLIDTYCIIDNNEIWLKNSYIKKFDIAAMNNHEERCDRKLLMNKKEIKKWAKEIINPGLTIIPIKMFINRDGLCKVEVALCKGKKEYDKRQTIKDRDNEKYLNKIIKQY